MAKVCKSCGNFYKGDFCDKCGYGKEGTKSKVLEKYKKATPKKPVRFMTEEEIKAAGKGKKVVEQKTVDPNGRRNLLIAIALVTIGVVIYVLISRGLLFSNNRDDVIKQYFTALNKGDFDDFVDTMPKEIKKVYTDERSDLSLGKEEYMKRFKQELAEVYGDGLSINFTLGREEQIKTEDIDLGDYKKQYGSAPKVTDAYCVYCEVNYSGSKGNETVQYECYVGKVGWKWKIFNMELIPGTIKADAN